MINYFVILNDKCRYSFINRISDNTVKYIVDVLLWTIVNFYMTPIRTHHNKMTCIIKTDKTIGIMCQNLYDMKIREHS